MKSILTILLILSLGSFASAQQTAAPVVPVVVSATAAKPVATISPAQEKQRQRATDQRIQSIVRAEEVGIEVRLKDIARFRGVRSNQLQGIGLLVGLNGTGDTKNTPFTATLLANAMHEKTIVDITQLKPKNVAVVFVSAELPAFASPGNRIDATVTSAGDATSLQGGYLLRVPLYSAANDSKAYAVAMGPISIGGFNVSAAGSSVQKNHVTVGRLPEMAIVEQSVDTSVVFNGKLFLELNQQDFTTAQRIAEKVNIEYPQYEALALDGGTVQLTLPTGKTEVAAMSELEEIHVFADTPATVVINENTGTIVMGGNVRIGPAVVAKGSLTVRIDQDVIIGQANPFFPNQKAVPTTANVQATEDIAQMTTVGPTTSVADLAMIFGALKVSATDMIAILEALRDQGALKATLRIQ
jgi:flagellar P-ring protein precursor FlgI